MILNRDDEYKYWYQLTDFFPSILDLDMALEPFRHDRNTHCCVKTNKDNRFAIFTLGSFIMDEGNRDAITRQKRLAKSFTAIKI